ncbi:hypothetical protein [Paenibacillus sp. P46E]|uniref:hypothetical protein n=1 Tax=Paenibacillus sp. P46E TaxID=1349436 RepID=UPI00093C03E2|nr:hypothetical protein [Paenibacillus sp. P46E]OKP94998.1 hypothetical protein A3849_28420 [Paenibacillus sp. P46E]
MEKFSFVTTDESEKFCEEIILEMIRLFNISDEEAWGRLNEFWKTPFGEEDIRYHEGDEFWAKTIYYGPNIRWWKREGDPTLKPVPYPKQST